MSRTYKDRPDWVKKNDPAYSPYIEHDHRNSECIEETFDDLRRWAGGQVDWKVKNKHSRVCKKIIRTTWYCTRKEPYISPYGRRTCWITAYDYFGIYSVSSVLSCTGHIALSDAPDEPCSCDRHPEPIRATCNIAVPRSVGSGEIYNNYTSRTKRINADFTRPTRARVRDDLRGMIDDYNTNGNLSDAHEDYNSAWEKVIPWWD